MNYSFNLFDDAVSTESTEINSVTEVASSSATSASTSTSASTAKTSYTNMIFLAILVVLIVVYFFMSSKRRKQQREEVVQKLNSLEVGDYIKTIGGICGTIAEVCQDGSLVLATGSESCPGYIRIDRQQAIAEFKKKTDIKAEEPFAENVNENAAAKVETAEESPVENVEPAETEVEPVEAEVATENVEAEKVETENVNSQDEPTTKED